MNHLSAQRQRLAPRTGSTGFTLIELMVALVLGMLIVVALVTLLIDVNRNNTEMAKTNRLVENGRFSIQILGNNIAHAGFWGGHVPSFDDLTQSGVPADYPTAIPDPCGWDTAAATPADLAQYKTNLVGLAVQGYEVPASGTAPVCASKVTAAQPNTDLLFVRHLETCLAGVDADCAAPVSGEAYMQVDKCGTTLAASTYTLDKYPTVSATVDTVFPHRKRGADCTTAAMADKRKYVSSMYYVRRYAVTDGDGIPTLMRADFKCTAASCNYEAAQPIIEGVEGFRVEYGIDNLSDSGGAVNHAVAITWADATTKNSPTNRGDGLPDGAYVTCTDGTPCTVAQMANVVALKLYVLARSEARTAGYTNEKTYNLGSRSVTMADGFKRQLFTQTVRLTNVSSRRETP